MTGEPGSAFGAFVIILISKGVWRKLDTEYGLAAVSVISPAPRNRRGVAVQPEQFRAWSAKWTDRFTWRDGTWVVCDCQCSMAVRHQMEEGIVGRAADCVRSTR